MISIQEIQSGLKNNPVIHGGYGEYVVYRTGDGKIEEVDEKIYQKCYDIFSKIRAEGGDTEEASLQEIDPEIKITFIPRTLYELFFLRECVQEDLDKGKICENIENHRIYATTKNDEMRELCKQALLASQPCWHTRYSFKDFGNDQDEEIKKTAYRLNNVILKKLDLTNPGNLSFQRIHELGNNIIEFMKECHITSGSERAKKLEQMVQCADGGVSSNISNEMSRGGTQPCGIPNEEMAKIIQNAIALECSKKAKNSFILYRGSIAQNDHLVNSITGNAYSLSYGTGLFAGAMFDPGATAFRYMRGKNNAFALLIPKSMQKDSPFCIPKTHPLCQFLGGGELFHARTKAWTKNIAEDASAGCSSAGMGSVKNLPDEFKADVTKEKLEESFGEYMKTAISLI